MNIDGSDPKQLTSGLVDLLPSLSPDGQWVVYSSLSESKATLRNVPLAGGTPAQIIDREGLNPVVSPATVVLSFSVSILIGIFFGLYPASRAAALTPIEALRFE